MTKNTKICSTCKIIKTVTSFNIVPGRAGFASRLRYGDKCRECRDKDFNRDAEHSLRLPIHYVKNVKHAYAIEKLRKSADSRIPKNLMYAIIKKGDYMAWHYSHPLKVSKEFKIMKKYRSRGISD